MEADNQPGDGMAFGSIAELLHALEAKAVTLHTKIKARLEVYDAAGKLVTKVIGTTPGRMLLSELFPKHPNLPFSIINRLLTKKEITNVIDAVYRHCGQKETVIFADRMMGLGFGQACKAGITFGKDDLIIPESKHSLVADAQEKVKEFEQQYQDGLITQCEKYNKVVDVWSTCTDKVAEEMMNSMSKNSTGVNFNSVYMMAHSGARGSAAQIKQLAGMRGLMAKPSGEIIETPIISNFKEGLTVLEYFNSTHGARKGLADTALKTANSGYLTRRLVDVAQDCIITEEDCGTTRGIALRAVVEGGDVLVSLGQRVLGRSAAEDIKEPGSNDVIVPADTYLDEYMVDIIEKAGVQSVKVRSVLVCEAETGVCGSCYGRDLARGTPVNIGEAVGVIAAQSIGEPGTQLTMRTFHIGGAAQISAQSFIESNFDGKIVFRAPNIAKNSDGEVVAMVRNMVVAVVDPDGTERAHHRIPYGARLRVEDGQMLTRGQRIAEWDPYTRPILTEVEGEIEFEDMVDGLSMSEQLDESTGIAKRVVIDWRTGSSRNQQDLRPAIVIKSGGKLLKLARGGDARYQLAVDAIISVDPGGHVKAGDVIARIPTESAT